MNVAESRIRSEKLVYETLVMDGVRVARPEGMTNVELACALHAMAQELLLGSKPAPANGNGSGNGHNRVAQLEQADRRAMPRKKVLERKKVRGGTVEKLECGHTVELDSNQKKHGSRACPQCFEASR